FRRRRRVPAAGMAAAACALLLCGCVSNAWNKRAYDELEELGTETSVVEEVRRDAEAERARREALAALDSTFPGVYRISPGDKIEIRVYGEREMDITTRIGPDGSIGMMFVGQTTVSGLTIAEARDEIESKLSEYIKHPVVGLAVLDVASETVTVGGSAARPGLYQVSQNTRLADVYAMAGGSAARLFNGIVVDVADLENSIFVRDGKRVPVDFRGAIERGDPVENIRVRKGDYIFIAQRMESSVTICGDVRNPHKRLYEAGMGILEALATAGWTRDDHWRYVIVIRDGLSGEPKMYKVDVDGILAGSRRNVRLRPNDIVFVPRDEFEGYEIAAHRYLPEDKINIPVEDLEAVSGER
ncbi:MAG: polysaccharide biosynthesis/export family protein, partial [Kiritimatiellae bacterium]|nr:polysaccharide biosynthesis/export family protein [Kiritimatiellia bacterium]